LGHVSVVLRKILDGKFSDGKKIFGPDKITSAGHCSSKMFRLVFQYLSTNVVNYAGICS